MFEIVYDDDGRRTDGRRLDGYTISSPCEPNGSGELKIKECGFLSIKKTKLEYLSSIIFHTVINLKLGKNRQKSRNMASFLYRG